MNTHHKSLIQVLREQEDLLANQIVERQYDMQSQFWESYGSLGRAKSVQDVKYHFSYLLEAINAEDPSLFGDYVAWVKVLFANLNFPDEAMIKTLECTREVLRNHISADAMNIINDYIEVGLQQMNQAPAIMPTFLPKDSLLTELAQSYIDALLRGERHVASRLILDAVEGGVSVKDVYLDVFQASQYEIGRLWMTNKVSVAQEHYCTAATQLIMSQLYPHIFSTDKIGRRFVATCVGGELHEIGVRMVADFFEMAGWDTYYLGANTPASSVLRTIDEYQPDVVGISATMTFHLSLVEDLIAHIRASETSKQVNIFVGGYPFRQHPDLWQKMGANGYAPHAQQAVDMANMMVEGGEEG